MDSVVCHVLFALLVITSWILTVTVKVEHITGLCIKWYTTTSCGVHSPSYTLQGPLPQTLWASDLQERGAQRDASRPPKSPEQSRRAWWAGPTRKTSLRNGRRHEELAPIVVPDLQLGARCSSVRAGLGYLVADFHQATWFGAECSCTSFSPSAPPSPSWL